MILFRAIKIKKFFQHIFIYVLAAYEGSDYSANYTGISVRVPAQTTNLFNRVLIECTELLLLFYLVTN